MCQKYTKQFEFPIFSRPNSVNFQKKVKKKLFFLENDVYLKLSR